MAKHRHLYQEIDKKLKQIDDGCDDFQKIFQKLTKAVNSTQRERFEAELKKVIKKLQKQRDQIKNYLNNPDVRDKNILTESRRKVEVLMEAYKKFERDSKTKTYSNEALAATPKTDPRERERASAREFIQGAQDALMGFINQHEAELESFESRHYNKDTNTQVVKELKQLNAIYTYYYDKLDLILRQLENEAIDDMDKLWELKDLLDYLLANQHEMGQMRSQFDYVLEEMGISDIGNEKVDVDFESPISSQAHSISPPPSSTPPSDSQAPPGFSETAEQVREKPKSQWQIPDIRHSEEINEENIDDWEEPVVINKQYSIQQIQRSFEQALTNEDRAKSRLHIVKSPHTSHPSFPKEALFTSADKFQGLELDTLLFIFYHQQGTYQHYLAAKELKRKNWKYHTKYQTWFQRYDNQDSPAGTYLYFDFDSGWCQRKRTEFVFEETYLEDELSPQSLHIQLTRN